MSAKNLKIVFISFLVFLTSFAVFPDPGKAPNQTTIYLYNPYLATISKSMIPFRIIISEDLLNQNLKLHMQSSNFTFYKDFTVSSLIEDLYQDVTKFPVGLYDCFFQGKDNLKSNKVKVSIKSDPPEIHLDNIPDNKLFKIISRNIILEASCNEKLKQVSLQIDNQLIPMNNYGFVWKWEGFLPFKNGENDVLLIGTNYHNITTRKLYKIFLDESKTAKNIPVLVYHNIGYMVGSYNVTPDVFEEQIKELVHEGCYFADPVEVMNFYNQKINLPEKSVMITFDDGYKGVFQYALPILKKYHVKSTLFVITSYINRPTFLKWEELDELFKSGLFTFGSHTDNLHHQIKFPRFLVTYSALLRFYANGETLKQYEARVLPDLIKSKKILEKRYRKSIFCFAYPFGSYTSEAIWLVKKVGFSLAFTYDSNERKYINRNSNLYLLERYPIFQYSSRMKLITEEK